MEKKATNFATQIRMLEKITLSDLAHSNKMSAFFKGDHGCLRNHFSLANVAAFSSFFILIRADKPIISETEIHAK